MQITGNDNNARSYIVVTPCKNEAKNLPNVLHSIEAQTIKPTLWVIVNDGSTDRTGDIIAEISQKYEWIKGINLEKHEGYMGVHIAYVCSKGFEFAISYCNEANLSYDYIALVDADTVLEREYFEKLMQKFEEDEMLGIASGNNGHANIERILTDLRRIKPDITVASPEFWQLWDSPHIEIVQDSREDLPLGSARMWRKRCFEETGGYLPVAIPDAVSNAKAKMKGWKTGRFKDVRLVERHGLKKQGLWRGYKEKGETLYYLGQPMYFALAKAIHHSFEKPYYTGFAYFYGYAKSFICRKEQIDDEEIREYFSSLHHNYYKEKIKKKLAR